jgi:hypothetical protein
MSGSSRQTPARKERADNAKRSLLAAKKVLSGLNFPSTSIFRGRLTRHGRGVLCVTIRGLEEFGMSDDLVADRLSFGDNEACTLQDDGSIAVVHACRHRCYRNAAKRDDLRSDWDCSPIEEEYHLYLDIVDRPDPVFEIEHFAEFFRFVNHHIKLRHVLIHCNQGQSRAPTFALLYMAKRLGLLPNGSYDEAAEQFSSCFPYSPNSGISSWVRDNWDLLDFPDLGGKQSKVLYYLDRSESLPARGVIIRLSELPPDTGIDERSRLQSTFPDGLTPFGHDIALKRLDQESFEREVMLEKVRRDRFAHLPSRYTSVLACPSPGEFRDLRWLYELPGVHGEQGRIRKVRGEIVFQGDMSFFLEANVDLAAAAEAYWSKEQSHRPIEEVLLKPPVMVLGEPYASYE